MALFQAGRPSLVGVIRLPGRFGAPGGAAGGAARAVARPKKANFNASIGLHRRDEDVTKPVIKYFLPFFMADSYILRIAILSVWAVF